MSDYRTALGDRMKSYENVWRGYLPRRTYTIVRVDGRAFHSYLRGCEKPYDQGFMANMDEVARSLCKEMTGAVLAYVQSDEISVLMTDFGNEATQPYFGGNIQKICSIAAATASVTLHNCRGGEPVFDARVFTISDPIEVMNYFIWRQQDCIRNSIQMAGRAKFSHNQLHGKSVSWIQEMLEVEHGIIWRDYDDGCKFGRVVTRRSEEQEISYTHKKTGELIINQAMRSWWQAEAAPRLHAGQEGFLGRTMPFEKQGEEANEEVPDVPECGCRRTGFRPDCWCTG